MVLSPTESLLVCSVLIGVGLCGVGVHVYGQWREPGVAAFVVFLLAFGAGTAVGSALSLLSGVLHTDTSLWYPLSVVTWALTVPPWTAFALQYTGTYTDLGWRTALALVVPLLGVPFLFAQQLGISNPGLIMAGFFSLLSLLGCLTIGCYLLVRTAHQYGHLSTRQGITIAAIPVLILVESNFSGLIALSTGLTAGLAVHTAGVALAAGVLVVGVYGYGKFESAPAVGTIGERAIVRQTDELMFVVDDDDRIIQLNETAADTLGVSKADVLGEQLDAVLGECVSSLTDQELVQLTTDRGTRQFNPVCSELTDQYDRQIGHTLALHDVTELELREQRLEVLNRVLRHNLRNQVEVIQANAEALADEDGDEFTASIIDSADRLTELGRRARSIDQIVSRHSETTTVDGCSLLERITDRVAEQSGPELSVSLSEGTLVTDKQALEAAAESAVEGALSRATARVVVTLDTTPQGYALTVTDDGPGIPEDELASVIAGTETSLQHATGLELWRLKWAVTKLNGELSFENESGTTIEITIPDQAEVSPTSAT
jgi:PAS domain S-box-containing protein